MTLPDRFPPLTLRGLLIIYQLATARIGLIFMARAYDDPAAMPEVVYGGAAAVIHPFAWAAFFFGSHLVAAGALLIRDYLAAGAGAVVSVIVYVVLGFHASGAPGGLVVEEFSIGLHGLVQGMIAYECYRRLRNGDE